MPARQLAQGLPVVLDWPAGQAVQAEAPAAGVEVPAAHVLHAVEPIDVAIDPIGHNVHVVALSVELNFPSGQK